MDQQEIRSGNCGLVRVNQGLFLHGRSMVYLSSYIRTPKGASPTLLAQLRQLLPGCRVATF